MSSAPTEERAKAARIPLRARPVIGCTELIDLERWGIRSLRAKIDTGARSSALHVEHIIELPGDKVRFDVRLHRKKRDRRVHVEAEIARRGRVRSSSGHSVQRIFVRTLLKLGPLEHEVELSLVDREQMIYRMLLGRTALSGLVLVDPGRRYMLSDGRASRATVHHVPSGQGKHGAHGSPGGHWGRGSEHPPPRRKR